MNEFSDLERLAMRRALLIAMSGLYSTGENPRVGACFIRDGEILSEGFHRAPGQPHAEIEAIAAADSQRLKGSTCVVTLEPCSHHGKTGPCVEALIKADVSRVVVAMADPNPLVAGGGIRRLQEAGIDVVVDHDAASNFVANEHVDHTSVSISTGTGLSGGGDISSTRTLSVDAAQTGITSVVNSGLEIGRDADNRIKFGTDNQIIFEVDGGDNVIFKASGEIEASSLDISGDADIDGTLEADAITVGGTALNTVIAGVTVTNADGTDSGGITGSVTRQITNTDVDAVIVTVTWPQIQVLEDDGDIRGDTVKYKIQIQYQFT